MQNFLGKLLGNSISAKEKALKALEIQEAKFIRKQQNIESPWINQKLEGVVPEKLQITLKQAFNKAFELVFSKGKSLIEKTYNKEEQERTYKMNAYASELKESKKTIGAFSKQAGKQKAKNLLISGVEGIGLGALGVGLPDIPLFTGVLLKSIYEIALSYGFSYEEEVEQIFILKLIEGALLQGEECIEANQKLNDWIDRGIEQTVQGKLRENRKQQIQKTADILSNALLYMKFIQGIPIVGVIGGVADTIYLNKITTYAHLKYKRRFLKMNRSK